MYLLRGFKRLTTCWQFHTESFHHIHLLHCVPFESGEYMFNDMFAVNYWWTMINSFKCQILGAQELYQNIIHTFSVISILI